MPLSGRDYREALEIIGDIYLIPDQKAMIGAVCRQLQKSIGIHSGVFISSDPKKKEFHFSGYELFNNTEASMLSYLAHFSTKDPFISNAWFKNRFNEAARITDLVPDLIKTEFACDFLIPVASAFYSLGSWLKVQGDMIGIFIINRQKHERDFSRRDVEFLNILLPHISRSIYNMELVRGRSYLKGACGVIMTDIDGAPVFMNNPAKKAIKGSSIKCVPDPGFGTDSVFFKNGAQTFRVRTVPASGNSIGKFVLLEPHPPVHIMTPRVDHFKLSPREKEISALVIQGHSNREIAERLLIREQTVKDHLSNIFGKLEIRRRSEMAAFFLGLRKSDEKF